MATLYVTEYSSLGYVGAFSNEKAHIPAVDSLIAFQNVVISTSPASSNPTNTKTKFLKLCSDTNCWLNFATNAAVTNDYLPANAIYYVAASAGTIISVIHV